MYNIGTAVVLQPQSRKVRKFSSTLCLKSVSQITELDLRDRLSRTRKGM